MNEFIIHKANMKKRKRFNKITTMLFVFCSLVITFNIVMIVNHLNVTNNNGGSSSNNNHIHLSKFIMNNDNRQHHNDNNIIIPKSRKLHNDILRIIDEQKLRPYGAEAVWEDLLQNGVNIMKQNNYQNHLTVIEVGAQNENQSLLAATLKFIVHCIEPSPKSFEYIQSSLRRKIRKGIISGEYDENIKDYIHLYNVAAGAESDKSLDFYSTGGTGDHVGEIDMWNMKIGPMPDDWPEDKRGSMVKVPSVQLDDIIYRNKIKPNHVEGFDTSEDLSQPIETVYALKVDTQGFEPSVFAGLKESINAHKIQYIMTEFWPKGMGLMGHKMDDPCSIAVEMLDTLNNAGYKLFALPTQGHPSAWSFSKTIFHHVNDWKKRPLDDYEADCRHFLNFETEFPNPDYHMGYWSDILAIAPGVEPFVPKKRPKKTSKLIVRSR